jgi:hypothetical protein
LHLRAAVGYRHELQTVLGQLRRLNSVSGAFATNKQQTVSAIQPIAGLGDQAFCIPGPFATAEVLKRWIYLTVVADTCPQAQKLAGTLLTNLGR